MTTDAFFRLSRKSATDVIRRKCDRHHIRPMQAVNSLAPTFSTDSAKELSREREATLPCDGICEAWAIWRDGPWRKGSRSNFAVVARVLTESWR